MAPSPTAIKQSPDGMLNLTAIPEFENMDAFDVLPDPLLLIIFNFVSDVKTLIRCRVLSKRFNSLVPQTESLLLKINSLVSPEAGNADSSLLSCFNSILKSLHNLVVPRPHQRPLMSSPAQILRDFQTIRDLDVELPSGDMQVEKDAVVMWRAEFGRTLRSCVIFGFRETGTSPPTRIPPDFSDGLAGGLKLRVVWTIGAMVAASSRHYLLREVVKEQKQLASLVVRDKQGEGMVVMDKDGLKEFREALEEPDASDAYKVVIGGEGGQGEGQGEWERKTGGRTMVPNVKLRMRHALKMDVGNGAWVGGATLVIVKPTSPSSTHGGPDAVEVDVETEELNNGTQQQWMEVDVEEEEKDAELAIETFGEGVHGPAVRALLKKRGFLMEMNSF